MAPYKCSNLLTYEILLGVLGNAMGSMRFELKIMPLVPQNQQSTVYSCHNWHSELTMYANEQKVVWELLIIGSNLRVSGQQ